MQCIMFFFFSFFISFFYWYLGAAGAVYAGKKADGEVIAIKVKKNEKKIHLNSI